MITPVIEQLAEENAGAIKIGKLNIDESGKTAQQLGINSIPTLLLFKNGEVVERMVGVKAKTQYQAALDACLE
jgi:thioredoxin 1